MNHCQSSWRGRGWLSVGVLALVGCAQLDAPREISHLSDQVQARTGANLHWRLNPADAEAIHQAVQAQLTQALTPKAAVQVALLASPQAQRLLDELDWAGAERVQASRLPNPLLEVTRLTPRHEGRTGVETALHLELLGALSWPLRQRLAQATYAAEQERITAGLLALAVQVRKTYWQALAATLAQRHWTQLYHLAELNGAFAEQLAQAGNLPDLQRQRQRYANAQMQLQVAQAEVEARRWRLILNQQMGLWGSAAGGWTFPAQLPPLPSTPPSTEALEAAALAANLQRRSLEARLRAQAEQVGLRDLHAWLPELALGYEWNREVGDGERNRGVGLGLALPLAGSVEQAQAQAQLRILERDYVQTTLQVRTAAQQIQLQLAAQWQAARQAEQLLGPLAQGIAQESLLHFHAMQIGLPELLQDRQRMVEAALQAITTLRDYWLLDTDFNSLQAGILPPDVAPERTQSPQQADTPAGGH